MGSVGHLGMSSESLWSPQADLNAPMFELVRSGFEGLVLEAPRDVDLRARATLPAAAVAVVNYPMAADWSFREHTLLVACEVDRLHCLADLAAPIERPTVRAPRRPSQSQKVGSVGSGAVIEVRRRLQLPWETGTWQLLLLTRDRRSEPVRVVLHEGGAVAPAPAPLQGAHLALTATGQGLDTVFDVDVKVRGSRAALGSSGAGGEVVVPVTFVVTGHAHPGPQVVRHAAAGRWGPAGASEHVVASARIALKDLLPGAGADDYYVWAFAGDQVSAPVRAACR